MLHDGIIEESANLWPSPIVVAPKPEGSLRVCNDFQRLNRMSELTATPFPGWTTWWSALGEPSSSRPLTS